MKRFYLNMQKQEEDTMTKSKVLSSLLFIVIGAVLTGCVTVGRDVAWDVWNSGDYQKAITDFKLCVDNEGNTGKYASECRFMLGMAYYRKEQYKDAIDYFKKSFDLKLRDYREHGDKSTMEFMHLVEGTYEYWLGMAYLKNKQYKEAISTFTECLEKAKENPEKTFNEDWGQYASMTSVKFWREHFLPLYPPKYACYFKLGDAYRWDKQNEQAVKAYQKGLELNPNAPDYYTSMAIAYFNLKQFDKAIAAANRAIEIKPSHFPYGVLRSIYEKQGNLEQAIAAGKKAIELEPKEIDHYISLSEIFAEKEDYANAIDILKKAQEQAPDRADIANNIGYYLLAAGRFDEAISSLNKAISLSTITGVGMRIAIVENHPVVVSLMEGPAKRAGIEVGDKIIKINGQSTKGWTRGKVIENLRGAAGTQVVLTIERNDIKEAIEKTVTRETITLKEAAIPFAQRSFAYREKGNMEESYRDAEKAYYIDPNNLEAKSAISIVYIDKGRYVDAIKMLSTINGDSFASILKAIGYSKLGDTKKAVAIYSSIPEGYLSRKNALHQSYKKALLESLKPYINAQKDSAKSLEAKGQYKEALNLYVEILKVADDNVAKQIRNDIADMIKKYPHVAELPEDARRHVMRAEVLTKEGKFEDAVNEYKEAIKIAPYFPMLYKAIALNYAEMKEYRKAINNLKTYVELSPNAPDARAAKDEIYKWELMMEKEGRQ